jgi:hypothetical protein
VNSVLTELDVSNNYDPHVCESQDGAGFVLALIEGLKENDTLCSLDVTNNLLPQEQMETLIAITLSKASMKILCGVPFKDDTLTELDVSAKGLGETMMFDFNTLISTERALVVRQFCSRQNMLTKLVFGGTEHEYDTDKESERYAPCALEIGMTAADFSNKVLGIRGSIMLAAWIANRDCGSLMSMNLLGTKIPIPHAQELVKILTEQRPSMAITIDAAPRDPLYPGSV